MIVNINGVRSGASVQACWLFFFSFLLAGRTDTPSCVAEQPVPPPVSTFSPGCSSCSMMRMSGQSSILEQELGVQGPFEPTAAAGCVSFRAGKKVRCSQSCPPPSWSSLASVPTSHRILGSVRIYIFFFYRVNCNTSICKEKKKHYHGIFPVFSTCVVSFAFVRHAAPQTQHSLHLL